MAEINNPPSKKYRFAPKSKGASIRVKGLGLVTAETLTDAQAEAMLEMGGFDKVIIPAKKQSPKKD